MPDPQPSYYEAIRTVPQPVEFGGTGHSVVHDVLSILNIIADADVGVAGGVVPLDETGRVPSHFIGDLTNKTGDTVFSNDLSQVYTFKIVNFLITNFDFQRQYEITSDLGYPILINNDNINDPEITAAFTSSATLGDIYYLPIVAGMEQLVISDKVFTFEVKQSYIETPELECDTNYENNATLTLSPFNCIGYMDTQTSVEIEITYGESSDTQLITLDDVLNNDMSFTTISLENPSTEYDIYIRVRYGGARLEPSEWSEPVYANYVPPP